MHFFCLINLFRLYIKYNSFEAKLKSVIDFHFVSTFTIYKYLNIIILVIKKNTILFLHTLLKQLPKLINTEQLDCMCKPKLIG